MAARVKLTAAEGAALVAIALDKLGAAAVVPVLASTLPADKVARLLRRESTPLTVAEKKALVEAVIPLLPGKTPRQKINAVVKDIRPAFATRARYDEVMAYVHERVKAHLAAPAVVVPAAGAVPAWDVCTHASCWGGATAERRAMNILSPTMPESRVKEYLDWQTGLGANTVHLILANHRDGEFGGYTIYGSTWGWQIHRPTVDLMLSRILECRRRGFAVVIWFITDDSAPYAAQLKKDPARYCRDVRDLGLLQHASIVCPALEKQDHFGSRKDVAALIAAVRSVWPGKVATHEVAGKTDFADLGDICFLQLYPNKSPAQVKAAVAAAVRSVGRPVNAFEISRNPNKALCDAAFSGGAIAVGNCDGGPGPFTAAPAQPAPSDWPAEMADVTWLHANVRDWPATAKMTASISSGQIHFPYDKANAWPVATSGVEAGTNANVWAIVNVGGQWYAATWEWLRKGQTSKEVGCLNGAKGDHFKVAPLNKWRPKSGEQFYLMVSGHARASGRNVQERSNPVKVKWP